MKYFKNALSDDLRQAIFKNGDYDPYPDEKLEAGEIQKLHLQVVEGLATTNGDAGTHVVGTRQLAILLAAAVEQDVPLPAPEDELGQEPFDARLEALPRLQQQAGAAYTLYLLASKALQGAFGNANAINWAQVHQDVWAKAVGQDKQPAAAVLEAIKRHSPGAITPEQIAAVDALGESRKMVQNIKKENVMQFRFDTSIKPTGWSFVELSEDDGETFPRRLTKEMITFDTKDRQDMQVNEYDVVLFYDRDTARHILGLPGKTIFDLQEYDRTTHARKKHEEMVQEGKIPSRPRP